MTLQPSDLICLSHLRWAFVFQRPQHLMGRFARDRRVFFFEEPIFEDGHPHLKQTVCPITGVRVLTPVLPNGLSRCEIVDSQRDFLNRALIDNEISDYVAWYYTPMAREFSDHLSPKAVVYDCMDELSAFAGAPAAMRAHEQDLFRHADLVFTGGTSLFESKRKQHAYVHRFPSSVDVPHFAAARAENLDPPDQRNIPHPRIGYAGVIDERMDLNLLREVAEQRPDWQFVMLGPVVKVEEETLPRCSNIRYLGMKAYADLPRYLSGWEIGMLPFALNESTRFISPTKTPEYLAAGLPVISTPIRDVINPYSDVNLVGIAYDSADFIRLAEEMIANPPGEAFLQRVDRFLSQSSWDRTWAAMNALISETLLKRESGVRDRKEERAIATNVFNKSTARV